MSRSVLQLSVYEAKRKLWSSKSCEYQNMYLTVVCDANYIYDDTTAVIKTTKKQ